ncbi:MAG: hypothetical protein WAQ53_10295 [Thiofilum sp.]|uniref:hypothetical protein n=1 Tax=Thiofilum sp. TaxID=2212733 RepID=UPI0025FB5B48|nr:hypothetical protein [Thiofilum sp.]MBK8453251.1 hypothetical protein [Thiofilum sp.]
MIVPICCQRVLLIATLSLLCTACQEQADATLTPKVEIKPTPNTQLTELALPPMDSKPYITDQYQLPTGLVVQLWQEQGQCQLQIGQHAKQVLALQAPCRFMRSPATDKVQVFKADRVIRVVALVGDVINKDCGNAVRALIVRGNSVHLADKTLKQGSYCVSRGLENAHYVQFLKP